MSTIAQCRHSLASSSVGVEVSSSAISLTFYADLKGGALKSASTRACTSYASRYAPGRNLQGFSVDARLRKILEPADVEHCRVPHVLKRLPGQRRPTTRAAVQKDRLVFLESGVVKLALGVSPELQHAPRDVHCTFDLPALPSLMWVADIDDHHVTGSDLLGRLGRR